jgi:hypothetical protein
MSQILNLITPPAVEPVAYSTASPNYVNGNDAKSWLRLDTDDDQATVTRLISVSRYLSEKHLERSFITTSWEMYFDGFPYGGGYFNRRERYNYGSQNWLPSNQAEPLKLSRPPLISVTSLQYLQASNTWITLDPSTYRVVPGTPGRVLPAYGSIWPFPLPQDASVKVEYTSGYGPDSTYVPATIIQGILTGVTFLYENRGQEFAEWPQFMKDVLDSCNQGGYA